jgi:hypothetical protein
MSRHLEGKVKRAFIAFKKFIRGDSEIDQKLGDFELPSNKSFGMFFCLIFTLVSGYFVMVSSIVLSLIFGVIAILFGLSAYFAPSLLHPFNRLWLGLGILLGKLVSPMVLGLIFFGLLTPLSLVTRIFGRDELKLRKRNVQSYWIERTPPGPQSESFRKQF